MMVRSPEIVDGTRLKEYFREEMQKAFLDLNLQVSETAEFYLVNLLNNFERSECLFVLQDDRFEEEPLAIMLAHTLSGDKASKIKGLKRLGDVALYVAGFFGDHLRKGPVGRDYYIGMGSSAYAGLAGQLISEKVFANLYTELSEHFAGLSMALSELSISYGVKNNLDLLNLYERWLKSGDNKIREILIKEGLIPTDKKISC